MSVSEREVAAASARCCDGFNDGSTCDGAGGMGVRDTGARTGARHAATMDGPLSANESVIALAIGPEGELLPRAGEGGYRVVVVDSLRRPICPVDDALASLKAEIDSKGFDDNLG